MGRGAEEGHGSPGEGVFRGEQGVEEPLAKTEESEQEGSEVPVASGRLRREALEPWEEQSKASSPGKVLAGVFSGPGTTAMQLDALNPPQGARAQPVLVGHLTGHRMRLYSLSTEGITVKCQDAT